MTFSAGDELRHALGAGFARLAIESVESRSWASVTFAGERHRMILRFEGDGAGAAADSFLDGLDEREFGLRGHILADLCMVSEERDGESVRLTLEALTVEES